ncbi:hypothetical protein BCR37DRAFT_349319 [Protomyces lactucae-debilis]|uniref:B30.2/SPRY domain-containing protein n=1 Tax=Protomyces lactucae-debilis TaxID=2754530 RepID=A0A1Y2F8Q4_PROLT|nr:uncharacterized protein BCR37DRAFT_349319 [Protomyces lactucae-debilis]ORY80007.1 hypothetical protein BCR37DRAFT_349319 [Protomyces lactucae-debilis]
MPHVRINGGVAALPHDTAASKAPRRASAALALPPDHSLLLGYDTKVLTWNATHTLNEQHKYCYCGADRNLLDVDVSCWKCKNYFHGRCIRLNMGPVVPFLTNYHFTCKHCHPEGQEEFKRMTASWKSVAATTIANLLLMRIRASNPTWKKEDYAAAHVDTLSRAEGWFLRKTDMVPFLTVPRHWAAICSDRTIDSNWQSPLGVALSGTKELFKCFDEENRSANAHYTLLDCNLFLFRANYVNMIPKVPGQPKKRKAEVLEGKAAATAPRKDAISANGVSPQEAVPRGAAGLQLTAAMRFRPPPYKPGDLTAPLRLPTRVPVEHAGDETFYAMGDLPFNKRGFRYTTCEAAPELPSVMYRSLELPPHAARIDWSDMSQYVYLSHDALSATTDKGFRTARANVGVREGSWYWEIKVLCGNGDRGGHVRLGVARREATLDAPIGFDGYGYGLRDRGGEKMHLSRPRAFMEESFGTGDVIGFHLQLPKVPTCAGGVAGLVSRERIPIRYRGQLYFEQLEYVGTREMEDRLNPATAAAAASTAKEATTKPLPVPGTLQDPQATLKGSSIVVYRNGKRMGIAFKDLLNFLPPFSQTRTALAAADDGTLGYYPAVSVFSGGAAQFNFGPDFTFPPTTVKQCRPLSERYAEQIAEDIVWDLMDEVDFALQDEALGHHAESVAPAHSTGLLAERDAIATPGPEMGTKAKQEVKG